MGKEVEGWLKREGTYIYIYGWFMLILGGNKHNSIKQLSFNLKNKFKKESMRWFCIMST